MMLTQATLLQDNPKLHAQRSEIILRKTRKRLTAYPRILAETVHARPVARVDAHTLHLMKHMATPFLQPATVVRQVLKPTADLVILLILHLT